MKKQSEVMKNALKFMNNLHNFTKFSFQILTFSFNFTFFSLIYEKFVRKTEEVKILNENFVKLCKLFMNFKHLS